MGCAHRKSLSFSIATSVPLLPDLQQSALPWEYVSLIVGCLVLSLCYGFLCSLALSFGSSIHRVYRNLPCFLYRQVTELFVSASFPLFFCARIIFQVLPCDYSFHSTFCPNSVSPQCFSPSAMMLADPGSFRYSLLGYSLAPGLLIGSVLYGRNTWGCS